MNAKTENYDDRAEIEEIIAVASCQILVPGGKNRMIIYRMYMSVPIQVTVIYSRSVS